LEFIAIFDHFIIVSYI